ncbi:hypothetical protein [Sulfurovum sp. NBC37-1]|uniref:hypothetical protein n=1 Tax=Sulfurovum sp. (strain NBC37-1) TaxID=387093 RepID=UPI000158754A|nr:hypothetical protein [Sulfurovum sp. NBC37-1]BAF71189.1 hypothetical protein SUN_0229 [Sulfurovum sp. NBC37-1]
MKIIKLFFLLTFGLWSEFKLEIPNEENTEQLQYIVENGWNDKNETLNQFIIKYGEKFLPEVLKKIKKPILIVEPTLNDVAPIPKILLTGDDYWCLLSYIKYLENIGKLDTALNIYIKIFNGLNNIDEKSVLSMVYRIEIEKRAISSLTQGLKNNLFSNEQENFFKNRLSELLLFDTKIFFEALEKDRIDLIKVLKADSDFKDDFLVKVDSSIKNYNKEYYALKKEELKDFDKKFKEEKNKFLEEYNKWQSSDNEKTPGYKVIRMVSGILVFEGVKRIDSTKIDLWRNIETNKALIKSLESKTL